MIESFHDDSIYGFRLVMPEPARDIWRSELVLDIDHIIEWVKTDAGKIRFRMCQADLYFEDVSGLRLTASWPDATLNPLFIDRITRSEAPIEVRRGSYKLYKWEIILNDQADGKLAFTSTGYRLDLKSRPALFDEQNIPAHMRI